MKLTVAILLLAGLAAGNPCNPACRFKFCGGIEEWTVGLPDRPFTDQICVDGVKIGPGATTGEALIGTLPAKPISTAALVGLTQPFSRGFVKAVTKGSGSALAHETPQGNQADFLQELCLRVPVLSYTVKVAGVSVNRAGGGPTDCIGVVTELPDPIPHASAPSGFKTMPASMAAPLPAPTDAPFAFPAPTFAAIPM